MLERIITSLREQATPELIGKLGLSESQASGSINAAADSVKQAIGGGDGIGMDDLLNLFSDKANTANANGIMDNIGGLLKGKLSNEVGLDAAKASGVKEMLMPMLMQLVSKYVGGDSKNLQSLLGGLAEGGLAEKAKGMLGGLFK
ncbi:MAG: hypothetical protein R2815_01250 [Flavobacteriales bacterium]|nr:hypothetical protein [Flavobacteriales bacterium]